MQNKFLSSCDIMWIMNEYHDNYKWHKGYIITNFWVSEYILWLEMLVIYFMCERESEKNCKFFRVKKWSMIKKWINFLYNFM